MDRNLTPLLCFISLSLVDGRSTIMIPAAAELGGTAHLYCAAGDTANWGRTLPNVTWHVNSTSADSIKPDDKRYQIKEIEFWKPDTDIHGLPRQRTSCPFTEPPDGMFSNPYQPDGFAYYCKTSVLTVSGVTAEDYDTTFFCSWYQETRTEFVNTSHYMTGRIVKPEKVVPVAVSSVNSSFNNGILTDGAQCVSNSKINWYVSLQNRTLTDNNEPQNMPQPWVTENLYRFNSWKSGDLYESIFHRDEKKLLTARYVYCGASNLTATYVGQYQHKLYQGTQDQDYQRYMRLLNTTTSGWPCQSYPCWGLWLL